MPRYVALLRGVSPMNAKMPELKRCFEDAGFTAVRTLLSSGNVVFDARATREATLERKLEKAMAQQLERSFPTIVRTQDDLRALIEADPFAAFRLPAEAKRVVTFLRDLPQSPPALPPEMDGARILAMRGREVLSAYVPNANGPIFMRLIEKTYGSNVTTRTWNTVGKCAAA